MRQSIWTIRRTLVVVVLVVSLARALAFNYFWLPRITAVMTEAQTDEVERQMDVVVDALMPFLLSRQYAAIHETLDSIMDRNPNWISVVLADETGRKIFPFGKVAVAEGPGIVNLTRAFTLNGSGSGRIMAVVDISMSLDRLRAETESQGRAETIIFLALMGFVVLIIDRLIIRRVTSLADAADQMAHGNFSAAVPQSPPDEIGRLINSFVSMRSRIAQNTEALSSAREAAESALVAKSQFLARMSHEIRTPLNGVIPVADILCHADLDEEHRHHAEVIRESGSALLAIVDDILDLAKIEEGRFELDCAPMSIKRLIAGVRRILFTAAEKKGLEMRIDIHPSLWHAQISADEDRLRQVLINLAGNAIKFTNFGAVTLGVEPIKEKTRDGVRFFVKDTGIGIAEEDQARIFERFEQAEGGRNRQFGGSGLGLAISRFLIEAHGSAITIDSTPGKGSTFSFCLWGPVQSAAQAAPQNDANRAIAPEFNGARALIVDDNATNRFVAKSMMAQLGFEVDLASNGSEALNCVADNIYDVVLMDMHMPRMDGLEATRQIRALPGPQKHVRIIALTASVLADDVQKCKDAGMDGFVAKPLSSGTLRDALAA
ncbi:ATP-binding protein [Primorskyibacter sp. 2E107]|uniref:ATP-binding protein n=1 Tax=Primorskyibacter sp. 2E107 TaxID=3403458 RepID=UPI003AF59CDB